MGTRADFYTRNKRGVLTYRGSIAWDGNKPLPTYVAEAGTAGAFVHGLYKWFKHDRSDATLPARDGWPWPWVDSSMTDCAYVFDVATGKVNKFEWGKPVGRRGRAYKWPNMSGIQKVTYGERSGILLIR